MEFPIDLTPTTNIRRTKIVATIGPASNSYDMLSKLVDAGVNVFRLNFSHGDAESHREQVKTIRQVLAEKQQYVALMGDLQGPKIRLGQVPNDAITINDGDSIQLTTNQTKTDETTLFVDYATLCEQVATNDILLLDDGFIRLRINSVDTDVMSCEVIQGGVLKSRKGLNKLGGGLSAPAITEKDLSDIGLAVEFDLDYLAVSFPACAADLDPVKQKLAELNSDIHIISKIERAEAVANNEVLDALIHASDGVMVARGDLGVEIGDANLISTQKNIITRARMANKPVITATQMMESMITSPVPTRAEVFDVANAVLDGTDAVMLSAETAIGEHPDKVVKAMINACEGAAKHPGQGQGVRQRLERRVNRIDEAIAVAAMYTASHTNNLHGNICITESGNTALVMSRFNSPLPIYGLSRNSKTCARLALFRGVEPVLFEFNEQDECLFEKAMQAVHQKVNLEKGARLIITTGDINGSTGFTNTMKILCFN